MLSFPLTFMYHQITLSTSFLGPSDLLAPEFKQIFLLIDFVASSFLASY